MNNTKGILLAFLTFPTCLFAQLGGSCGSPYLIPLDGVTRTYTASSNTDNNVVCTYNTTSPVTWFSFTTNASAEMPLLDITAGDSTNCEIAMYTGCNGNGILQTMSSMCFDDGWGLWTPAQNYSLQANTTYRLRIKTSSVTQIKITGQNYTPSNNTCSGATPVDAVFIHDNNAANRPSSEVTPGQLCAYTLENTAFYQFYIASAGAAVINISSIACDNGAYNNDNGIQIGFFTGTCGGLAPLSCAAGPGPYFQATTPVLSAGTKVYVAIDGNAGSNCQYDLQALNAFKVLSAEEFKNFSVWKKESSNILKWTGREEKLSYYEIERSENGSDFMIVGRVETGSEFKELLYQFEDKFPPSHCFYRVKLVNKIGRIALSNTLRADRSENKQSQLFVINPARDRLAFEMRSNTLSVASYVISSSYGQIYLKGKLNLLKGINKFDKEISALPGGQYVLSVVTEDGKINSTFIKLN